jgi:hypothetical protein
MLDDLVGGIALDEEEATVGDLEGSCPIAPSCRSANESYLGFVVLEGRGGGVRRPEG